MPIMTGLTSPYRMHRIRGNIHPRMGFNQVFQIIRAIWSIIDIFEQMLDVQLCYLLRLGERSHKATANGNPKRASERSSPELFNGSDMLTKENLV